MIDNTINILLLLLHYSFYFTTTNTLSPGWHYFTVSTLAPVVIYLLNIYNYTDNIISLTSVCCEAYLQLPRRLPSIQLTMNRSPKARTGKVL